MPGATNQLFYTAADTLAGGKAVKITAVSSTGVLTYAGGTINPVGDAGYLDDAGTATAIGAKCIPSFISAPLSGGRSDFTATGKYTAGGWVVEFKRALKLLVLV